MFKPHVIPPSPPFTRFACASAGWNRCSRADTLPYFFLTGSNSTTHAMDCLFLNVSSKPAAVQFTLTYTGLHVPRPSKAAFRQSATLHSLCN